MTCLGILNAPFSSNGSFVAGTFGAKVSGVTDASVIAAAMPAVILKAGALAFIFAVLFNVPCVMALFLAYRVRRVWGAYAKPRRIGDAWGPPVCRAGLAAGPANQSQSPPRGRGFLPTSIAIV